MIEARFDDMTEDGASFRLVSPVGVLEARTLTEVLPTIRAAEAAATRGLWVGGFVAYEAAPGVDPTLAVRERPAGDPFEEVPLAWFAMFEGAEETRLPTASEHAPAETAGAWSPSIDRARYARAIATIHERIGDGDTYQVNFTFRLRSSLGGDERGLYRDLCHAQRGAYGAYLNLGRYRVLSASPELFFAADGGRLVAKPMKGTARRGRWPEEDERAARELVASGKDRAENAMIVDLLRNDMGRVSREGSVTWSDLFAAERFETVWQLTSTISSDLAPGTGLAEVFGGLFPSGSVTGAPKVRTMELIADLEDSPRGVYCGAVGYVAPGGDGGPRARFNVAIRTVTVDARTGTAEYGVGGGITWDSRAEHEYDETVAKAQVLTARRPRFDLLETLRHEPDAGYRRLEEHVARLQRSAAYFGFAFDGDSVRSALSRAADGAPEQLARVRLLLSRDGRVDTGVLPLATPDPTVRLAIDLTRPVDPNDVILFHKTTLRAHYEEARARHPDADDVVLVNARGLVTETTIANLAVRLDGRWWTPPLGDGLLPGVERAALLDDGTLAERSITVQELKRAEEIAVLNSVRGFRRATLLEIHSVASRPSSGKT
jgi:para-aminobenzoate synthetase / 4-amino-4-deoxychorismate lyase